MKKIYLDLTDAPQARELFKPTLVTLLPDGRFVIEIGADPEEEKVVTWAELLEAAHV
jgi:hypothetical protein